MLAFGQKIGSGSERRNESAKNVEMKAPKIPPEDQTRRLKIWKCQKIRALFQMFYLLLVSTL